MHFNNMMSEATSKAIRQVTRHVSSISLSVKRLTPESSSSSSPMYYTLFVNFISLELDSFLHCFAFCPQYEVVHQESARNSLSYNSPYQEQEVPIHVIDITPPQNQVHNLWN